MNDVETFRNLLKTIEVVKRGFGIMLESESDLTMAQWCVLKEINLSDANITSKDLELLTNTDKATMSEILSKLVKKGYIIKEQDQVDRRKYNIRMTNNNHELCEKIMNIEEEYFSDVFKEFDEKNYEEINSIVKKIKKGCGYIEK